MCHSARRPWARFCNRSASRVRRTCGGGDANSHNLAARDRSQPHAQSHICVLAAGDDADPAVQPLRRNGSGACCVRSPHADPERVQARRASELQHLCSCRGCGRCSDTSGRSHCSSALLSAVRRVCNSGCALLRVVWLQSHGCRRRLGRVRGRHERAAFVRRGGAPR
eukprot:Amastigsp_a6725_28.p3 type:complete len:167 gc:universal Amastigsp_a6725_28:233-733(+)